jgi:nitrate/TMAO reductase-like tetraheme cytochrome c subunit
VSSAQQPTPARAPLYRNWVSLTGAIVAVGSLFSFLVLFVLDTLAHFSNPYIGILTYFVAPAFLFAGIFLILLGVWIARRRGVKAGPILALTIDLSRKRDRRILGWFITGGIGFLLLSALGSYQTYHFTESVMFCGEACHTVMKPEMVTYHNGSHARVACVECHIGPGAEWFVKAKISGTYQLYAVAFNKFPRPVPTPIRNLRPARETCEQCHWPEKFVGDKVRTYTHYLGDETNTHHEIMLLLKVGGANPAHGPVSGIHWHVYPSNKVEYLAAKQVNEVWSPDETRQSIPWVRMTDGHGAVTEYRVRRFTNDIAGFEIRTMDCMDCHNRPAHRYRTPNDAVNTAIDLGQIDPGLAWIKTNAVFVLTQPYNTEEDALEKIAATLNGKYPDDPRVKPAIAAVQDIYRNNFFPEMKASWKVYPENTGHKDWPGCARCHDDEHKTADGRKHIVFNDCAACHIILAQGSGRQLEQLSAAGQSFAHPSDEIPEGYMCSDCHTGGP